MSIIEIAIGRAKYKIECPENEQTKLCNLANKFNERVKKNLLNFSGIDERTLLVVTALSLEDELESKVNNNYYSSNQNNLTTDKINDDEIYKALTENIENIANYIEKLAKKIENY